MSHRVILSPDAKADISSAVRWYQLREPKLAFRFMLETQAAVRRMGRSPREFPFINGSVRRALLKQFPYAIYFTLNENGVFVIAIVHQRRDDTLWMDRGNGRR